MQFELDFYGHRVITYVRDGHIYLHRRSVADLLDVNDEDDLLDPIMPLINDAVILLPALEKKLPELIQHTLGNTVAEYQDKRALQLSILKDELIPVIVKQLTYQYKALPLISVQSDHVSGLGGVIDQKMPWGGDDSYFTMEAVSLLLSHSHPFIPEDIPFHYVMVKGIVWSPLVGSNEVKYTVQKLISLHHLGYVLRENATPRNKLQISPYRSKTLPVDYKNPYEHTCGKGE